MNVGELLARLKLDTAEFDSGLKGAEGKAQGFGGRLQGILANAGKLAMGAAAAGAIALGGALVGTAASGFELNNSMEQASAKIMAFTKDAGATADILDMVRDRASRTPFAFAEMSNAAAALIPSAKEAGVSLEDIIAQAEILAASNPAEGLEGAAFAIKEAVSGDFASAIERFNLPRQYINELREQGVPNLEILQMAMAKLGYDTDLVTNLANTAEGRWSTLKDTFQGLAAQVTQPIFDAFSAGLGNVNGLLERNAPMLSGLATSIGSVLAGAIQGLVSSVLPALISGFITAGQVVSFISGLFKGPLSGSLGDAQGAFEATRGTIAAAMGAIQSVVGAVLGVVMAFWRQNGSSILSFTSSSWNQVASIITTVMAIIQAVVVPLWTAIAGFISSNQSTIVALFSNSWNAISGLINGVLGFIQGLLKAVLAAIQGDWSGAWTNIKAACESLVLGMWAVIRGAFENGKLILATIGGAIRDKLIEVWGNAKEAVLQRVEDIKKGVADKFNDIKTSVANAANDFLNAARSVGKAIVDGIASGIRNGASAIVNAARDAAQGALDAAKRLLGIKSPSRAAAAQVGLPFAQGIAAGIVTNRSLVSNAIGEALSGAMANISPVRSGAQAASTAVVQHYHLNASYANYQSEGSLRDDVRTLQLLGAGV